MVLSAVSSFAGIPPAGYALGPDADAPINRSRAVVPGLDADSPPPRVRSCLSRQGGFPPPPGSHALERGL
ncbi:hypothetical protein [Natronococcus jeotgali]|uniref:hypothetical protein n=1 Tax=Natronococcus jeotgali TaxID=413812 RepID=UPI00126792E3|nr:hypothetical protein [Natronococcus jeotgali]